MRPYIIGRGWGPHPAAADQKRRKEKGKPKNHKFEALYDREGLGPPPGSSGTKRDGKREQLPRQEPRIGLQGNPCGIQMRVTRRPGYLGGGVETPGTNGSAKPQVEKESKQSSETWLQPASPASSCKPDSMEPERD